MPRVSPRIASRDVEDASDILSMAIQFLSRFQALGVVTSLVHVFSVLVTSYSLTQPASLLDLMTGLWPLLNKHTDSAQCLFGHRHWTRSGMI